MQPLPRDITTSVFNRAADFLTRASSAMTAPGASKLLYEGGHNIYQGIPSLRMLTVRDGYGAELASKLDAAAGAAIAMSREIAAAKPGTDFGARRAEVQGWAALASDAAGLVSPPPSW